MNSEVIEHEQIIKCRDDIKPVYFQPKGDPDSDKKGFILTSESTCSWAKPDEPFHQDKLRSRIEPWLTSLVQSEHLSLLIGSGLTHAIHRVATGQTLPGMNKISFDIFNEEIQKEAERTASASGRESGNIEDQIRVANECLRGLKIFASTQQEDSATHQYHETLRLSLTHVLDEFAASILKGENDIVSADKRTREVAFNYLVSFLMSFASRTGTRDRLHIFTTNYDRCIEAGADIAGMRLIDRFVGTLTPVFRSSRLDVDMHYNPPGIRGEPRYLEGIARFTKLHGSIDWVDCNQTIQRIGLPFGAEGIKPYLNAPGLKGVGSFQLMIYPNSSKDQETALYPYVELFRDFAAATCRPNNTLVCYGYSFGDEHINRVIKDMLTIPSTHLVVIAHGDSLTRIMQTYEELGRPTQITLLIGDHLGDLQILVDHYLPKPAIDKTTFRMAKLLQSRYGSETGNATINKPDEEGEQIP
jgi:hypothetical protein